MPLNQLILHHYGGDKWRKQEDDIGDRLRQLGVKVARLNIGSQRLLSICVMWFKTNSAIDILMTIFVEVQFSVPNNRRLRNKLQQTEAI